MKNGAAFIKTTPFQIILLVDSFPLQKSHKDRQDKNA